MPDDLDVRPDQLHRGAAALRGDARGLGEAQGIASGAAQAAAGAAGTGPLTAAAHELASRVDKAVGAIGRSVEDCATAIDTAATNYAVTDTRAGTALNGAVGAPPVVIPGLAGPP